MSEQPESEVMIIAPRSRSAGTAAAGRVLSLPRVAAMKCARLRLHERSKPRASVGRVAGPDRPRRCCQKRMVDPTHDEDPRWADLLNRFYCNPNADTERSTIDNIQTQRDEDLFLSVQNIKFDGDVKERKRPKTYFKYKAISDGKRHRMFVKQIVEEEVESVGECSSQLTCYYFDDYVKYILNSEQNAPPSEKSSILLCALNNKIRENKSVQVGSRKMGPDIKKCRQIDNIPNHNIAVKTKEAVKEEPPDLGAEDTKIAFHKSGKRKCLTISRAQSPETVQVIRVDVVCNYSRGSTLSDDDKKPDLDNQSVFNLKTMPNMRTAHFSNKYLLTNTTKTLDENVSGGAKVTLLCKTFRLSKRTNPNNKKGYIKNKCK